MIYAALRDEVETVARLQVAASITHVQLHAPVAESLTRADAIERLHE
jgi:hypothetical protein